jgi:hypothetical protein
MNVDHGECDANCLQAKELNCTCRCGGKNQGAALGQNVRPLEEFEDPVVFDPDEYFEDLAVT